MRRRGDVKPSKFKTTLCQFFLKGEGCPFGEKCAFAHGESELRDEVIVPRPELSITVQDQATLPPPSPPCRLSDGLSSSASSSGYGDDDNKFLLPPPPPYSNRVVSPSFRHNPYDQWTGRSPLRAFSL